jgi:hypothetical protein
MNLLRAGFVVAVLAFAWLSLRGRMDEVGDALKDTSVPAALGGLALVLLGLLITAQLWLRLMAWADGPLPQRDGQAIFFIGQLGKYIPGSVWSIGAQADLARKHQVPARATVASGLLFLGYNVDTAVLVASISLLTGGLDSRWPAWVSLLALIGSLVGLTPALVRWAGTRIAGREVRISWVGTVEVAALMAGAWTAYGLALVLLAPGLPWHDLVALGGAFAAAYAVGVVIVIAPAGVGARETVFVLLLTPALGVGPATALALLARVVHTVADTSLAAAWWAATRRARLLPDRDHRSGAAADRNVIADAGHP